MKRWAIVSQFWDGDKADALEVARLIGDLEPGHNDWADFIFSRRFDAGMDESEARFLASKFNVSLFHSKRRTKGWPAGPNDLVFAVLTYLYEHAEARRIPWYDGILLLEGDTCPLRPGWLEALRNDWETANSRQPICMMGALSHGPAEHLNGGCAVISGRKDFLKYMARTLMGCHSQGGWDYILAPTFKRYGWFPTPLVQNQYHRKSEYTPQELEADLSNGLVAIHGIKNNSIRRVVRDRWLPRTPPLKKIA